MWVMRVLYYGKYTVKERSQLKSINKMKYVAAKIKQLDFHMIIKAQILKKQNVLWI